MSATRPKGCPHPGEFVKLCTAASLEGHYSPSIELTVVKGWLLWNNNRFPGGR